MSEFQPEFAGAVVKSDTVNLSGGGGGPYKIYIGVGGDIPVQPLRGAISGATIPAVVFKNMASGTILPVLVTRVNSTNTSATDMVYLQ